jgi:hypothetical protein
VAILLFSLSSPVTGLRAGSDGKIRVIAFGDVIDQYHGYNSFTIVRYDPAIAYTPVPTRPDYVTPDQAQRNLRIYMPRTYRRLADGYDIITTSDAFRTLFRPDWISWMTDSVTEGGLGFQWLGTFATESTDEKNWYGTTIGDIAPVGPTPEFTISGSFRFVINDHGEELMKSLPWEGAPPCINLNTQTPKEGASVWGLTNHPKGYPFITYWRVGQGAVMNFASKFPNGVEPWARTWRYFPQAMIYMIYRLADKRLPEDPEVFEEITRQLIELDEMRSFLIELLSFVENFGGRIDKLHAWIVETDGIKALADQAYLEGDFDECLVRLAEVREENNAISQAAIDAKSNALFWVYVVEWCSMMATFMISSIILWSLMIRRRLYREVGTSRMVG